MLNDPGEACAVKSVTPRAAILPPEGRKRIAEPNSRCYTLEALDELLHMQIHPQHISRYSATTIARYDTVILAHQPSKQVHPLAPLALATLHLSGCNHTQMIPAMYQK